MWQLYKPSHTWATEIKNSTSSDNHLRFSVQGSSQLYSQLTQLFSAKFCCFGFCFCPAAMSSGTAADLNLLTIEEGDELLLGEEGEVHMDDVEELLGEDPPRQRSRSPRSRPRWRPSSNPSPRTSPWR